ncbi:MAG: 2'-5' RNA ligase family protein [Candidatus Paceibacterota bacterium]
MRYFIGNLIRGEAAEYYKATCEDLANHFGVENISIITPPRITVKSSFERPNIDAVDDAISLLAEAPPIPLALSGWNHFTTRTIFLDAPTVPKELQEYIRTVLHKLQGLGIPLTPQEQTSHIHMSIARFLRPDQYTKIWEYLASMPAPTFDIMFDNLTIFVKEYREDKAWKVLKTFPLTGVRK